MANTRRFVSASTAAFCAMVLSACGGSGGKVVDNNAKLLSTSLAALQSTSDFSMMAGECTAGSTRCTPKNVTGDLCYAILGMGQLGGSFFSMTWLAPASTFPDGPRSGTCSSVQFDLSASTSFSGKISIPETEGDMPSNKQIIRAELMYNYVDVTFGLQGTAGVDGTYVVRTVYATTATASDVSGTMQKGDKLIKALADPSFVWCNASTCSATRSTVASGIVQDATVTGYVQPSDGNPDYVNVTANFPTKVDVTYAGLQDTTKTWTLDFQVSNAIVWSQAPSNFAIERDIVDAFRLKFGPNQSTTQGETDDGIRASLTIQ